MLERKSLLHISDIPIKFNNTSILYNNNEYFSYDDVVGVITSMNKKTQMSPIELDSSK